MIRHVMTPALVALLTLGTGTLVAQQRNELLVATEPGQMSIPLCQLRARGKVEDGMKKLRDGIQDKDAAKRASAMAEAETVLLQAFAEDTIQQVNPAAWYWLGRTYLARGDVRGADSAFAKAQELQPDCELDIQQYRQNSWAILANAGIAAQQAGDADRAMVLFRDASSLFTGMPHVFENMGILFANANQSDSAAFYFARAATVAENDTTLIENRNSATLNLALMQQRLGQHPEAIRTLERYLSWNPEDIDAKRSLAYSLREAGMGDSAARVEEAMVTTFSSMNLDSLSFSDAMAVGVSMFNGAQFDQAAGVFEKLRQQNPWSRDANYNLANTYLQLERHEAMIPVAKRLTEIEPMNEDAYRLLGTAYRQLERQDSLIQTAERLVTLPIRVDVTAFGAGSSSARLDGVATGREARNAAGDLQQPVAVKLVVEFLGDNGEVLSTAEVNLPALPAGTKMEFNAQGRAQGIRAWRYRRVEG